ncbi:hypothetical protein ZWY2020_059258 [Hordeum vulgare]|nr:hypothetical protein ZWY2020_059258 [Hordeum vulgare]
MEHMAPEAQWRSDASNVSTWPSLFKTSQASWPSTRRSSCTLFSLRSYFPPSRFELSPNIILLLVCHHVQRGNHQVQVLSSARLLTRSRRS